MSKSIAKYGLHESKRVRLTVSTDFVDPTVGLTLKLADRETEIPFRDGSSLSWPLEMVRTEPGSNIFEVVVPCGELATPAEGGYWRAGLSIHEEVSFDDGSANCRTWGTPGEVVIPKLA